jgi:hypothetical protein
VPTTTVTTTTTTTTPPSSTTRYIHRSTIATLARQLSLGEAVRVSWEYQGEVGTWFGRVTRRSSAGHHAQVCFDREEEGGLVLAKPPLTTELPGIPGTKYVEVRRLGAVPDLDPAGDPLDPQDAVADDDEDEDEDDVEDDEAAAAVTPAAPPTTPPPPPPPNQPATAPPGHPPGFPLCGTIPPGVADLKGGMLAGVLVYRFCPPHIPAEAWKGLVSETRAEHRRILQRIQAMPEDLRPLPFDIALLHLIRRMSQEGRGWAPSTLLKKHASAQGALSALPLYSDCPHPILMGRSPTWRAAMSSLGKAAKETASREPTAAKEEEVFSALGRADAPTATALALAWVTAARLGCVLQLEAGDITLTPGESPEAPWKLRVEFRRGKGVLFRGPYTVHTLLPVKQAKVAANLLAPLRSHQRLFPTPTPTHKAVLAALRARNLTLEVRSLRRGALQTLALTTPEDLLLNFSGHTNVRTLRRYLGWGRILGTVAQATTRAAIALLPTTEAAPFQRGQVTLLRRPDPPPYPTSLTPGHVSPTLALTTPGTL